MHHMRITNYPTLKVPYLNDYTLTPYFFKFPSFNFTPTITIFFRYLLRPLVFFRVEIRSEVRRLLLRSIVAMKLLLVHLFIASRASLLLRLRLLNCNYFTVFLITMFLRSPFFSTLFRFFRLRSISEAVMSSSMELIVESRSVQGFLIEGSLLTSYLLALSVFQGSCENSRRLLPSLEISRSSLMETLRLEISKEGTNTQLAMLSLCLMSSSIMESSFSMEAMRLWADWSPSSFETSRKFSPSIHYTKYLFLQQS